eukprot:gnl/TRDRNA2_/TRDRNA2_173059_c0_seq1.p2 gnl/TRDRNA2_/TRDRNA2_173059_c0~~gnl/TRDRNA2_/TRDRNA2_173059_c0_seq1.p2  ORF type:complete len:136 (-),score=30.38 gnl/TRDRNA2_/TRDRNA2_173059_c0_seq1:81-437(-)
MALVRASLRRAVAFRSRPSLSGTGFGSPRDHGPKWIDDWEKSNRKGKDSLDWFFRAFNSLGLYEAFLKSSPRYFGFMVAGGIIGGYYWSRMWDHIWCYINAGKLYKDNPYVYPPPEDD